jgi:hypothetical protein
MAELVRELSRNPASVCFAGFLFFFFFFFFATFAVYKDVFGTAAPTLPPFHHRQSDHILKIHARMISPNVFSYLSIKAASFAAATFSVTHVMCVMTDDVILLEKLLCTYGWMVAAAAAAAASVF